MTESNTHKVVLIGIDLGTGSTKALAISLTGEVLADAQIPGFRLIEGLSPGYKEQDPMFSFNATKKVIKQLMDKLRQSGINPEQVVINVAGHMHGQVGLLPNRKWHPTARIYADERGGDSAATLSKTIGRKVPMRMTINRFASMAHSDPDWIRALSGITTPAGFVVWSLAGGGDDCNVVDLCEGSGMILLDKNKDPDPTAVAAVDGFTPEGTQEITGLLPKMVPVGGWWHDVISELCEELGLPKSSKVVAASGDQGVAPAASGLYKPGFLANSIGTTICCNSLTNCPIKTVHPAVDEFRDQAGTPLHMVWINNGTKLLNQVMKMFKTVRRDRHLGTTFNELLPDALASYPEFTGPLSFATLDAEAATGVNERGFAAFLDLTNENMTPGNTIISSMLGAFLNLRLGIEVQREHGVQMDLQVLTGGLFSDDTGQALFGQMLADVLDIPALIPSVASRGGAYGAALNALYTHCKQGEEGDLSWPDFMKRIHGEEIQGRDFEPNSGMVSRFSEIFGVHKELHSEDGAMTSLLKAIPKKA